MKSALYFILGVSMLSFATVASAHGVEGEAKGWGKLGFGFGGKHCAQSEEVAEFESFIGLSIEEVREAKKDGKSMGDILESQGKDRGETEEYLEARADARIEAAVERKDLSDEEEENLRERIYNFIDKLLDRWFGSN